MKDKRPVLCLDFDGVVHSFLTPWQGPTVIPDPPVQGAEAFIVEASEKYKVVIHSSRARYVEGEYAIKEYLRTYLPAAAPLVEICGIKPPDCLIIEDRVTSFAGVFPLVESIKRLRR